jgi:hypothetical protein
VGASRVILGAPQRSALINLLRGNVIREVSNSLPDDIDLLVCLKMHEHFDLGRLRKHIQRRDRIDLKFVPQLF